MEHKRKIKVKTSVYNCGTKKTEEKNLVLMEGDIIKGEVHDNSLIGGYAVRGKVELKWYVGTTPLEDIKFIRVIDYKAW
jgi:hypothetical protein